MLAFLQVQNKFAFETGAGPVRMFRGGDFSDIWQLSLITDSLTREMKYSSQH